MSKPLQQGQADGMCGLYALLNFLRGKPKQWGDDTAANSMWYLLDACRHFGWLTPQQLTEGFEDHQLKAILDLQIDRYRLPFATYFVGDVMPVRSLKSFSELVEAVLGKGGAIIANHERRYHWLLIEKREGSPSIIDSADIGRPITTFSRRYRSFSEEWGVVILPSRRPVLEIDL